MLLTLALGLRKSARDLLERPLVEHVLGEVEEFEGMSLLES
jgi:hypothetical protein